MATLCPNCGVELPATSNHCPRCSTADPKPVRDAMAGKIIGGRYRILRRLGAGGMGVVYEAEHVGVGQKVAIKFLHPSFSHEPEIVQRFHNEAKSYAQIIHPHAIQLHDFGADDEGNLYISMEYVEGCDLKRTLLREGRLPPKDAIDIAQQIADVLGTAHSRGIIHRDLKPENIMLTRELRGYHVKVLDFGLARLADSAPGLTAPGMVCGTPRYMAPEQADGGEIDHRVDLYALGLVLFEMLTGTHPFEAPSISETLRKQRSAPVPHLWEACHGMKLERVDAAIQKATAKLPGARYSTMLEFARAFSEDLPAANVQAVTEEDVAATSARIPQDSGKAPPPVNPTLPSAPRRIAEQQAQLQKHEAPTSPETVPVPRVSGAPRKKAPMALLAGVVAIAAICLGAGLWMMVRDASELAALRATLDQFYLANHEPPPPALCQERDRKVMVQLLAASAHLGDSIAVEAREGEAAIALAKLESAPGTSAESALWLSKARATAQKPAAEPLKLALGCAGFAAAENLAGNVALKEGLLDDAVRHYGAALQAAPAFSKAHANWAVASFKAGKLDEAAAHVAQAIQLQRDDGPSWFLKGLIHDARKSATANVALADAEAAQASGAFCKAMDLGYRPAKARCPRP